ncbi:V-set and transmembrane domain-containing protein 1 isoform X4 [Tupaia chinensis]|uniref:V-set and transmembrane domain-containing protein 1 isoform X4 n=1 Tax=Tupaia chinensis TaxID=246437 RepID=UPI0003C8D1D5|nr:V-set and transmembrane domain-containing protein 1 isoform X4 [Tupaia chinensis]
MLSPLLPLLCLGLCLGREDAKTNEKLPKPSLSARPSTVVERGSNLSLQCESQFHNATFLLEKSPDSGDKREQSSAGNAAEFRLTDLEPKDAGRYFCAYRTASHEWSEKSDHVELVVTDKHDELGAPSRKIDTRVMFVTVFSCLSILLLFLCVFLIYRFTQHGSSQEEASQRTSRSELPKQEGADSPELERLPVLPEAPQGVTRAQLHASAPPEEPLGPR